MSADVRALRSSVSRWAREVHGQALDTMVRNIPPYAPIGKGPQRGELRRSIRRDHTAIGFSASKITGRIVAPVVQAKTTDQGASAHRIPGSPLLAFLWPGAPPGLTASKKTGKYIFAWVNHPGNKAKPWWGRALRATYVPALRFAAIRTSLRRG